MKRSGLLKDSVSYKESPGAGSLYRPDERAEPSVLGVEEEEFANLFERLCLSLFGERIKLIGRKHAKAYKLKKLRLILQRLKDEDIDTELFLRAQFYFARENPKYLFFNAVCSDNALLRYRAWISEYPTEIDARKSNRELSLKEILARDRKFYDTLREKLTPDQIFQTHLKSFSPFFLFFSKEFKTWRVGREESIPSAVLETLSGLESKLGIRPFKEVYQFVKYGEAFSARRAQI